MPTSWRRPGAQLTRQADELEQAQQAREAFLAKHPDVPRRLAELGRAIEHEQEVQRGQSLQARTATRAGSPPAAFGARRTPAWGSTCDAQPAALRRRAHAGYRRRATAPRHDAGVVSLRPSRHARQASHWSQYRTASEAAAGRVHGGPLTTPALGMPGCGHQTGCGAAPRNPFSAVSSASSSALVLVVADRFSDQLRSPNTSVYLRVSEARPPIP